LVAAPRPDSDVGGIRIVTVYWPIVVIEFPEKSVPDTTLQAALGQLESLLKEAVGRSEKLFTITELTRVREFPPASQRKYTAEWTKRVAHLLAVSAVGGAYITPSAILRGIITAVFWVHPTPRPKYFVGNRQEAILKGIDLLEASKVPLAAHLARYREEQKTRRAG
jgi:hypothetical protein